MYLYNVDNYLRSIRREDIPQILKELDSNMQEIVNQLGVSGLDLTPLPEQNAIIVSQTEKWFDRSFENPNKEVVSGLICYYSLVGTELCTYTMFHCNVSEYNPLSNYFGTILKSKGIEEDSHFKKIKEFTEKLRLLYPKMMTDNDEVFYKNNYLLLNSYPATTRQRFLVAEDLKRRSGFSNVKYNKSIPTVSFTYKDLNFSVMVRSKCLLYNGIIYPDTESFVDALLTEFPLQIENIINVSDKNLAFIKFVKHFDYPLEQFIFDEQMREMNEQNPDKNEFAF